MLKSEYEPILTEILLSGLANEQNLNDIQISTNMKRFLREWFQREAPKDAELSKITFEEFIKDLDEFIQKRVEIEKSIVIEYFNIAIENLKKPSKAKKRMNDKIFKEYEFEHLTFVLLRFFELVLMKFIESYIDIGFEKKYRELKSRKLKKVDLIDELCKDLKEVVKSEMFLPNVESEKENKCTVIFRKS